MAFRQSVKWPMAAFHNVCELLTNLKWIEHHGAPSPFLWNDIYVIHLTKDVKDCIISVSDSFVHTSHRNNWFLINGWQKCPIFVMRVRNCHWRFVICHAPATQLRYTPATHLKHLLHQPCTWDTNNICTCKTFVKTWNMHLHGINQTAQVRLIDLKGYGEQYSSNPIMQISKQYWH